jgi:hypothetical protein
MDEPRPAPGQGWRGLAWVSLGVGLAISVPALSYRPSQSGDLVAIAVAGLGLLLAAVVGVFGTVCGIAGASKAADAGVKRFAVVLPMWCCLAFLLILAGCFVSRRR